MDRREFLKLAAACSAAGIAPELAMASGRGLDRIVVLVELKGGNDGFNTLVPFADPLYKQHRPKIGINEKDVISKTQHGVGMHPRLKPLENIWKRKEMAWIQGVGYPHGVLSHFRSMDIWDTASNANQFLEQGWLSHVVPKFKDGLHGIAVSPDGSSLGPLRSSSLNSVTMQSPKLFLAQAQKIKPVQAVNSTPALAHLTQTHNQLHAVGLDMRKKMYREIRHQRRSMAKGQFGHSLGSVAQMIQAGIDSPVYKVTMDGFDTHAGQVGRHNNVLYHLAHGLERFEQSLRKSGHWNKVLVVSYSEFGRRISENRGGGTDHGTASASFVMGGAVKGGIYGKHPDLNRLDNNGNLMHTTDFRQIYATIARDWWGQPSPWQNLGTLGFIRG